MPLMLWIPVRGVVHYTANIFDTLGRYMQARHILMALVLGTVVDIPFCIAKVTPLIEEQVLTQTDIVRVHDGDTLMVVYPGDLPTIFKRPIGIRVNGIDAPELNSHCKDPVQKANEERYAREAQAYLEERVRTATTISLRNQKPDKFFRIDADVIINEESVGEIMLDLGYAIPYTGDAKTDYWCQHAPTAGQ